MKKNFVLKCIAVLAMLLLPLPLLFVFDVIAFEGFSILRYLIYYSACIFICPAGYLLMSARKAQHKPKLIFLFNMLIGAAAIVFAVLTALFSALVHFAMGENEFDAFTLCAGLIPAVLLWYHLGMRIRKYNFDEVFSFPWLGIYLVETVLCYLFCCVMEADRAYLGASKTKIAVLLVVMSLITVILVNQTNIQTQIDLRRNTNLIVPKGLRLYNAKLIGIVGFIILAALLLKDYIAAGLTWMVTMTLKIIDTLIFNIEFQQTDPIYGEDTQIPEGNLFSTERGGKDFLIYILIIVLVILVIVFRKKIISFFKSIASHFFGKFSAEDTDVYEADSYTDSYEKLDIRQERITKTTKKDCLKMYRKEQDKTKKFRLGYRLYLMWLSERSSDNFGNMTVEQQAEKSEKIYHGENDTLQLAKRYSEIRYNDKIASDKDFEVADRLIDELYN
ncbi:MAG: hypothetical protein ACI4JI_03150 [Ruminiclostridium sp.]